MPKISVDLSNVASREPLPVGKYECIVESIKYGLSKASQQPTLNWVFSVAEGEHEGRKVFANTSLQEQALFKLKDFLEGFGIESGEEVDIEWDEDTSEVVEPNLIGVAVLIDLGIGEPYNGKRNNDIKSLVASSLLTATPAKNGAKGGKKFQ